MPCRGQQPALVHRTVDWCLPGCRYSGVGYGSAGGLAASGQRVGCHQELGTDRERISLLKKLLVLLYLIQYRNKVRCSSLTLEVCLELLIPF